MNILNLLKEIELAKSKSEAKRLVEQGGVQIDGEIKDNWKEDIKVKDGMIIKSGRNWVKVNKPPTLLNLKQDDFKEIRR